MKHDELIKYLLAGTVVVIDCDTGDSVNIHKTIAEELRRLSKENALLEQANQAMFKELAFRTNQVRDLWEYNHGRSNS